MFSSQQNYRTQSSSLVLVVLFTCLLLALTIMSFPADAAVAIISK